MDIAKETKQTLFLTFFDVKKAFDKADVNNMLHIAGMLKRCLNQKQRKHNLAKT